MVCARLKNLQRWRSQMPGCSTCCVALASRTRQIEFDPVDMDTDTKHLLDSFIGTTTAAPQELPRDLTMVLTFQDAQLPSSHGACGCWSRCVARCSFWGVCPNPAHSVKAREPQRPPRQRRSAGLSRRHGEASARPGLEDTVHRFAKPSGRIEANSEVEPVVTTQFPNRLARTGWREPVGKCV